MADRGKNVFIRQMADLQPNTENIRGLITDSMVQEKLDSLIAHGQITNLKVYQKERGAPFTIIEGNVRYMAAEKGMADGKLPVDWTFNCETLDKEQTGEDALILFQLATDDHNKFSPIARAEAYAALKKLNYSVKKIAKKLHKSEVHVKETLALLSAPIELQDAIKTGKISATLVKSERKTKSDKEITEAIRGKEKVTKKDMPSVVLVSAPKSIQEIKAKAKDYIKTNIRLIDSNTSKDLEETFIFAAKWALGIS